jgi:hypothetical protein
MYAPFERVAAHFESHVSLHTREFIRDLLGCATFVDSMGDEGFPFWVLCCCLQSTKGFPCFFALLDAAIHLPR